MIKYILLAISTAIIFVSCAPAANRENNNDANFSDSITFITKQARSFAYANKPDSAIGCLDKSIRKLSTSGNIHAAYELILEKAAIYQMWQNTDSIFAMIQQAESVFSKSFPHDTL